MLAYCFSFWVVPALFLPTSAHPLLRTCGFAFEAHIGESTSFESTDSLKEELQIHPQGLIPRFHSHAGPDSVHPQADIRGCEKSTPSGWDHQQGTISMKPGELIEHCIQCYKTFNSNKVSIVSSVALHRSNLKVVCSVQITAKIFPLPRSD